MTDWTRKNSFVRNLRAYLKRFRILEVKRDVYHELKLTDNAAGGETWEPTGRFIIKIEITGFWRSK